ncbi:RNA polymerase sigma factor [Amycolatopsis aidingensis]|uniref:RNA polymerase sigma factor n=1 Tax=Amycolatopsis aidingensis TaxID=2842453 RepID=UPI001C0AAF94|nr:sigma-70 family RNA polymerase sigma factor [Amycolatopsis aidingensis]
MDTEVTDRVRGGDLEALGHLFDLYRDDAYRVARGQTSSRFDADELVAKAFDKTMMALLNGHGPRDDTFWAYLSVVIRREAADAGRRATRDRVLAERMATEPTVPHGVERAVHDRVLVAAAAEAYNRLSPRHRLVLRLTVIERRRKPTVCAVMGLKPGAVDALACRARKELRRWFTEQHRELDAASDSEQLRPRALRHIVTVHPGDRRNESR